MKTVKQAYDKAYSDITKKGYCTLSYQKFSEGSYIGQVVLKKRATWKSPISITFRVRKKWGKKLLMKEAKQEFMQQYGQVK
jgi:hypothetical protein